VTAGIGVVLSIKGERLLAELTRAAPNQPAV
jgi:hypothetical protein